MFDPQPALDGAVSPVPGPPPLARHADAVVVKAECAVIIGWTTPPEWRRLLAAADDLHAWYWGVVNATDESRVAVGVRGGRSALENYQIALSKGREIVGDLDRTVRGATGQHREIRALHAVQDLAVKVRAPAFELDLQQNHHAAQRQVERFAAAASAVYARPVSPHCQLSYPHCTGGTR